MSERIDPIAESLLIVLATWEAGHPATSQIRTLRYLRDRGLAVTARTGRIVATRAGRALAAAAIERKRIERMDRNGPHLSPEELDFIADAMGHGEPLRFSAMARKLENMGVFDYRRDERWHLTNYGRALYELRTRQAEKNRT